MVGDWSSSNSWVCNAPQVHNTAIAGLTININGEDFYNILLFGGLPLVPHENNLDHAWQKETWIYHEIFNSWQLLDNLLLSPPGLVFHSLVTVCNKYIILIHNQFVNNTWIFLVESSKWQQVTIIGETPLCRNCLRSSWSVPTAVEDLETSCSCQQAILLFPCRSGMNLSRLYKLSCLVDGHMYRWREISVKYQNPKHSAQFLDHCSSQYFVPSTRKDVVYTIMDGCLSYYSVKNLKWTTTTSCIQSLPYLGFAFLSEENSNSYYLLNALDCAIMHLNTSGSASRLERILDQCPRISLVYSLKVVSKRRLVIHVKEASQDCGSSQWLFEKDNETNVWVWRKLSSTEQFPRWISPILTSFHQEHVYLLEAVTVFSSYSEVRLWVLDMKTMKWKIVWQNYIYTEILMCQKTRDGLPALSSTWLDNESWLIVTKNDTLILKPWKPTISKITNPMSPRRGFCLATVNSTTALLFGGRTHTRCLNDLWLLSSAHLTWKQIHPVSFNKSVPSPRYGHAAVVIDHEMFVFGGSNSSGNCLEEFWKFSISRKTWSIVRTTNKGPLLDVRNRCKVRAVAQAGHMWITTYSGRGFSHFETWMFIVQLRMWERLDASGNTFFQSLRPPELGFWRGFLVRISILEKTLLYRKVGCPAGLTSRNISEFPCDICKVGFYADIESRHCLKCPSGTMTTKDRSTTINDCNICEQDYCQQGSCLVATKDSTQTPICRCHLGFTGSRCQYATYYYISLGILLFVMVIILSLSFIWYVRRKRKRNEIEYRRQIQLLNDVWQIGWEELTVEDEIGGGGSGRVVLAQYRNIVVAVKTLKDSDDHKNCMKFDEEIKFMQTMRHLNIILFLGAGIGPLNQTFLVLEFARRGSLRRVLDDNSITLNKNRKVDFAIHASRGMRFLHNLNPARIHCDLKSENLLVSES
jgi:hypothetical protein